jgi:polyhydroxyalkanoate synthesis regulator phasin
MRKRIQKEEFSPERREQSRTRREELKRELRGEAPAKNERYSDKKSFDSNESRPARKDFKPNFEKKILIVTTHVHVVKVASMAKSVNSVQNLKIKVVALKSVTSTVTTHVHVVKAVSMAKSVNSVQNLKIKVVALKNVTSTVTTHVFTS